MDAAASLNAALAGRYEIEREIGEGGMANVYLARDVKHNRRVALKVLKPELGAVLGTERFLSEIQVTANLQHPNLLPLFDSGEAAGLLFYVMPFVEGESLRARLDRERQLPVDEAVRIGVAIAGALEYAHKAGVIHRDMKPENILLQAGQPVIADFGIALAVSKAGGARVTQTGLSLGTPQYMSPEQATGDRAIDSRTDIYSLGAIVYEMLTGEPPHVGGTAQAIIAKLMTEEVRPVTVLRRTVPPHVDAAVRHALQKLAADRFATAGDFAAALNGTRVVALPTGSLGASGAGGTHAGAMTGNAPGPMSARMRLLVGALALAAVGGVGTATWLASRPAPPAISMQFVVPLPDSVTLFGGGGRKVALSRDGSRMVVYGVINGTRALFVRRLSEPELTRVPGTPAEIQTPPSGSTPSFSPDGAWILYTDGARLMRIPYAGGTPIVVADSAANGSWGDGDIVAFTRRNALWATSALEPRPRLVARPDTAAGIWALKWPHVLPGGTHVLVTTDRTPQGNIVDSLQLAVVSITDGAVTMLGVRGTCATYVAPGYLMFGQAGGAVAVAPFSLRSKAVTGQAVSLLAGVWQGSGGATGYAASDNGLLTFQPIAASSTESYFVVDRAGMVRRRFGDRMPNPYGDISPDGRRVLGYSATQSYPEAWMFDVVTGSRERVMNANEGFSPRWSSDGRRILFLRRQGIVTSIVSRAWDRSGPDSVVLTDSTHTFWGVVSGPPKGWTLFRGSVTRDGLEAILMAPTESLRAVRAFVSSPVARAQAPALSPDGSLVAYQSDESGIYQVYVQPVPGPGPRLLISPRNGFDPVWSREGRTVLYRDGRRIQSATLGGTPLSVIARDSLFYDTYDALPAAGRRFWDVFPGGKEFLMVRSSPSSGSLRILLNWREALGTGTTQSRSTP